jgi:hypothetical protein
MKLKELAINLYHRVSYWTLPPGFNAEFQHLYRRLRSPYLPPEFRQTFERNNKFHNIHMGERCFILGTGPSINKQDLKPLKNETCIAISAFFLHKDIKEISPLYHVDAPIHPPYKMELPKRCFEDYQKYYSKKTTIFLGHSTYEFSYLNFLQQNPEFKSDNIYFLNYDPSQDLDEKNYNDLSIWDITKPLFNSKTVIYSAIQLAIYMGFKEIFILGCDYDTPCTLERYVTEPFYRVERFYKAEHFYKSGQGYDDEGGWASNEEIFIRNYHRWKQFRLIQQYLGSRGIQIFNATEGGFLDVFPRISLEKVLSTSKRTTHKLPEPENENRNVSSNI